ncbi:MAG: hypothetical protein WAM14_17000 [Candidatus Nitrosopolaris sp.]
MNHGVTSIAENPKTATGTGRAMILTTVALVLFTAMLIMATIEYPYRPANARGLTNVNHIDAIHNTHCDGDVCQTLTCINNNCRSTGSSEVLNSISTARNNSTIPCYLPCLPAQSKSP